MVDKGNIQIETCEIDLNFNQYIQYSCLYESVCVRACVCVCVHDSKAGGGVKIRC